MTSKSKYGVIGNIFKFISKVISWICLIILIFLAIFVAYYTVATKMYASRGQKFEPPISLYTIISPSMTPNINIYDVVVTKKVKSPNEIKTGDVITFYSTSQISRGMIITHRVVEIGRSDIGIAYKTKGDNNLSPDGAPAEYQNIIGKVIFRIPQLGRLQEFIAQKGGWLLLIVLPALFIIISDIMKIIKLIGVKNKAEKIDENARMKKDVQIVKENLRKSELKEKLKMDYQYETNEDFDTEIKENLEDSEGEEIQEIIQEIENNSKYVAISNTPKENRSEAKKDSPKKVDSKIVLPKKATAKNEYKSTYSGYENKSNKSNNTNGTSKGKNNNQNNYNQNKGKKTNSKKGQIKR